MQEVTNLPPVTGQGALGICFAHVASTMLTAENCRKVKTDCTTIADTEVFSPLALASAWRRSVRKPDKVEASASAAPAEALMVDEGGNAAMALQVVAYDTGSTPSLECASRRIMTPDYTDETATDRELAMWNRTKTIFKQLHEPAKSIDVDCTACVAAFESAHADDVAFLVETFPAIGPKKGRSVTALAQPDYGQFLYRLAVPAQCARLSRHVQFENMHKVRVKFYPQPTESTDPAAKARKGAPAQGNYRQAIELIRASLADQRPLALGHICLDRIPTADKCKNLHELVIAGLKTTCDAKGRCTEALKVVNSWGMGWQKANSDGWVDAKTLIDRTFYTAPILTWFVDAQ